MGPGAAAKLCTVVPDKHLAVCCEKPSSEVANGCRLSISFVASGLARALHQGVPLSLGGELELLI